MPLLGLAAAISMMLLEPRALDAKPTALEAKPRAKPGLRLQIRVEPAPDSATLARWLRQNSLRVRSQRTERFRALGSSVPMGKQVTPPQRDVPQAGTTKTQVKDANGKRLGRSSQGRAEKDGEPSMRSPGQAAGSQAPRTQPAPLPPDPKARLKSLLKSGRTRDPASLDRALRKRLQEEERRREQLEPGGEGRQQGGGQGQRRVGQGGR